MSIALKTTTTTRLSTIVSRHSGQIKLKRLNIIKQKSLSHFAGWRECRKPITGLRLSEIFGLLCPLTIPAGLSGSDQDPTCLGLQLGPKMCHDACGLASDPDGCQQCAMISLRSKAITDSDTAIRLQQKGSGGLTTSAY